MKDGAGKARQFFARTDVQQPSSLFFSSTLIHRHLARLCLSFVQLSHFFCQLTNLYASRAITVTTRPASAAHPSSPQRF